MDLPDHVPSRPTPRVFLFSDIEGSTALKSRIGDSRASAVVERHDGLFRRCAEPYKADLRDDGDGFLAIFADPTDAVRFSVRFQSEWSHTPGSIPVRIGIHAGEVVEIDTTSGTKLVGLAIDSASRIMGLARGGQILVSGEIATAIQRKSRSAMHDLRWHAHGLYRLKGVTEAIEIHEVVGESGDSRGRPRDSAKARPLEATPPTHAADEYSPTRRGRVAVIPFEAGSDEDDYLARGLAEDLILRLTGRGMLVIDLRSSSDLASADRAISELGAEFVVHGSVRRSEQRLRVTARLSGSDGSLVWTERFDIEKGELWDAQDELGRRIAAAAVPEAKRWAVRQVARRDTADLDAWDCFVRAEAYQLQNSKVNNGRARELLELATRKDPSYARAHAALAQVHFDAWLYGWADRVSSAVSLMRAAGRAIELDPALPEAHVARGLAMSAQDRGDEALGAYGRALELQPGLPHACLTLGVGLALRGSGNRAIEVLGEAMEMSPRDPLRAGHLFGVALGHFAERRFEEALAWSERSLQVAPEEPFPLGLMAACYGHLDDVDRARDLGSALLDRTAGGSLASLQQIVAGADRRLRSSLEHGLEIAGIEF